MALTWQFLSDIPSLFFVDELLECYPDAKVVVTSRDIESWVKSMGNVVYTILSWRIMAIMRRIDSVSYSSNYSLYYSLTSELDADNSTQDLWGQYIPWLDRMLDIWTEGDPHNKDALHQGF